VNLAELLDKAQALGLRLEPRGDRLAVTPADRVSAEFAQQLREHKAELLRWLHPRCPGWRTVPPTGLPLATAYPRPSALDARRIVGFVVRQIGVDIGKGSLCAWCLARECEYQSNFLWPDALCCYAAARDAACWQLARTEAGVWVFLRATEATLDVRSSPGRFGEATA
jgi:hypothetical protein